MLHLFYQTFPQVPSDIAQALVWLIAPETLFAFFLIYLKLPFVIPWPDWEKGAVFTVVATAISGVVVALQQVLTPDLFAKIQPFYAPFVIILNLVLGYYGIQALKRPLLAWWEQRQEINLMRAAADLASRTGREPDEYIVKKFLAPRKG